MTFFATIPMGLWSKEAAAAKADKFLLGYQSHPKNGKACANCWAYVPGQNPVKGTCKAIDGPISATGWCMAFSPKQGSARPGKFT